MLKMTIERNGIPYEVTVLQYSYDEIIADVRDLWTDRAAGIIIPVRVAPGFAWKCNAASVGCDSGEAADVLRVFESWPAYMSATVRRVCFENKKNLAKIKAGRAW